jgi:hypothetical protein
LDAALSVPFAVRSNLSSDARDRMRPASALLMRVVKYIRSFSPMLSANGIIEQMEY